ncbi:MAG: hypothetical protein LIP01_15885 [Tannerellaceae bacterium]|nr:hypothetical protein [Tannerellaceae bacterium]
MNNHRLLFIITLFLVSCQYKSENAVLYNNDILQADFRKADLPEKGKFIIPPIPSHISQCISKAPYQIGRFVYNPYMKTISYKEMVGGKIYDEEGNVTGHWDGRAWIPDTSLVYGQQGIYFINHAIFTKKMNCLSKKVQIQLHGGICKVDA